jgi:hypothetical protein
MSLQDELIELNTAYQNSREDVLMLQDRCQQLEQLVNEYYQLHRDYLMIVYGDIEKLNAWVQKRDALQQRAKELLASE